MANSLAGGMISGIGSGMLGLEMPLHPQGPQHSQQQQQQQQQNTQNPQNPHHGHPHPHMVAYAPHDADHHQQSQQSVKQGYQFVVKSKQPSPLSDDDEPADDGAGDARRKMSPWQRMKWTDNMVRLLIMAVYYIGDEAGSEGNDPSGKKKAGGLLQKKGKWKSVSRAMMEKGFYVSPQQCEDKFNDLNKRYKRVNDILGKGTACRVVENQSLLDAMDLSPKMKEEVRKLLNSKHLFFREMCAYHNSCGHGTVTSGANHSPEVALEPSQIQLQQAQQQSCLHSSDNAHVAANLSRVETDGSKVAKVHSEEDEDDEDDDSDEDEDDEEETIDGHSRGHSWHGQDDEDENDERPSHKRTRKGSHPSLSPLMQQFSGELITMMQDGSKSDWEKKQWMKVRLMQLEEQQVGYRYQAFELERQRLKWIRFSTKKEREMERAKLENERRRLEIERMVLLVRQKEIEVLEHQHQPQQLSSSKRGDPSSVTV
ncbi:hypothetical protein SLEP1_g45603 [Rubroshorea leprosula]|uniref:Myb/SANT-like DNA-binding domain-containing protein n=1 Tax=Rubroshorea leprosula TaxID=152421 RepID=A0AAV5LKA4_9ROSI|nr:hypothetical protein SLEP1_g45603 [Rubroshorea leprosula]